MKGRAAFFSLLIILVLAIFIAGCTQNAKPVQPVPSATSPTEPSTTKEEMVAFVQEAVAYAHANGKEKALSDFSNRKGSFFRPPLYIYAYDFNGTTIAHPVNPEKIGVNRLNETDVKGNLFIRDLMMAAENGTGFSEYYYINPVHNNAVERKLGYVMKVDDGWWLGSGIYYGTDETVVTASSKSPQTAGEIKTFVDQAAEFARQNGKERALASFNDPSGDFVKGNVYVYALDYRGVALALPFQHDRVGMDFSNVTDAAGQKFTQTEIGLAKNGGGFLVYQYPDPAKNYTAEPKISYVCDVDDTYWIGAGTYLADTGTVDPTVRQFVMDARTYARDHGRESAIREFNNLNGSFIRGDLYIFAYDYNGTVLVWPYRPDQIGLNRVNATDPSGKFHIREMVQTAKAGSGVVYYLTSNPNRNNATELKASFITDVDGTWFIGAGRYIAEGPVVFTLAPTLKPGLERGRDDLARFIREARDYAIRNGRAKALAEFNNKSGLFTTADRYIFAYTYNGTTLALPYQPELLGVNRIDMTDSDGVPFIREMAGAAKADGGFVDYRYPDPAHNLSVMNKTSYATDVDGTWFVGSGMYPGD